MMRIISGRYKGRRLVSIPDTIRPTGERLREALFSVLSDSVEGKIWLEPFAGSGAMGLEALSRGASRVIFNDREAEAVKVLRRNVALCGAEACCEIHQLDAFVFFRELTATALDFIFLDPPHSFGRYEKLLRVIAGLDFLQEETLIMLELFQKTRVDFLPESLRLIRSIKLGSSQLHLIRPEIREHS